MASNVVKVRVEADTKGFVSEFKKAIKSPESFGVAVGTMAGNMVYDLGRRALGAVTQFVGDSIKAFSELEQAVGGTEAVFGDASGAIDQFARESAEAIGLSEAEFRTATTSIGGQLKRMTGDVDLAADRSIQLTEVAADLAATYGGTTAEAVAALGASFRGEADPAERFNLNLKIGEQNAKAVALGLAESESAVSDNARAQANLALIMEQSADAQGQFGRESETTAGRQQRLNAELENQKALLGEALVPLHGQWMEIQAAVLPIIGDLADEVARLTGALSEGEIVIRNWEGEQGRAIETAEDLAQAIEDQIEAGDGYQDLFGGAVVSSAEFRKTLEDVLDTTEQSPEILAGLTEQIELLGRRGLLTAEDIDALTEAIEAKRIADANAARDAGRHRGAQEDLAGAVSESTGPLGETTGATEELTEAEQEAAEAAAAHREEIRKVAAEFKTSMEAMTGVSESTWNAIIGDVEGFLTGFEEVPAEADITMAEFEENFRARADRMQTYWSTIHQLMGIEGTQALVNELIAQGPDAVGIAQEYLADPIKAQTQSAFIEGTEVGLANLIGAITGTDMPSIHIPVDVSTFRMRQLPTGEIVPSRTGSREFAQGGVTTEGFLDGNGSRRKEAVIPLENQTGINFLAAALREAGGVGGVHITVNAGFGTNGHEVGELIVKEIEKARRRGVRV